MTSTKARVSRSRCGWGGVAAATMAAVISLGAFAPPASAEYDNVLGTGLNWSEFSYCVPNAAACLIAQDAQNWAESVTAWKFPSDPRPHNTTGDAFRHCAWNGAMGQRLGRGGALAISNNHELRAESVPAEAEMDGFNNRIGAAIGEMSNRAGVSDTWGYVLAECLSMAQNGGLSVLR